MPASLSSLITVPAHAVSAALSAGGRESRLCLRQWLLRVPDPRKRAGRWHPLEFVLALAVCAFTAAGHDSPTAIAECPDPDPDPDKPSLASCRAGLPIPRRYGHSITTSAAASTGWRRPVRRPAPAADTNGPGPPLSTSTKRRTGRPEYAAFRVRQAVQASVQRDKTGADRQKRAVMRTARSARTLSAICP